MFSSMFLDDFIRPRVYVVSDTQYKQHQQAQAQRQIDALEARAAEYRKYLDTVEVTIKELKADVGLLEPAKEKTKKK